MPDRLDAVIDHVAIAVPSWDEAERRWKDRLGGGVVAFGRAPQFWSRQLRFANGAKLELLSPPPDAAPGNFVQRFLDRFGAQVHHVTLKVPDLADALQTLADADLQTVDVQADDPHWQEAFLRPGQVGGLVVQVAWAGQSDEEWARAEGHVPEPPRPDAIELTGPLLTHPDLTAAARLWRTLGAEVTEDGDELRCVWPASPLVVRIRTGEPAGPVALLARGGPTLDGDPREGPQLRPV